MTKDGGPIHLLMIKFKEISVSKFLSTLSLIFDVAVCFLLCLCSILVGKTAYDFVPYDNRMRLYWALGVSFAVSIFFVYLLLKRK